MSQENTWTNVTEAGIDEEAPDCGHCHSSRTFYRSDGDIECLDCPGITIPDCTHEDHWDHDETRYAHPDADSHLEIFVCRNCGAAKHETWQRVQTEVIE